MCDTMVTLADDGVLFAKNSDRDANEAQVLRWYPAGQHSPGTSVACTWSEVPQVERTHAVLLSQPWWMWGAEMGANDQGVVIGNEAVFTRAVGDRSGTLLGMDLLRLALERAGTAEAAVQVLVELLEAHGQGGQASHEHPRFRYDNSFLVADPTAAPVDEGMLLEELRWAVRAAFARLAPQCRRLLALLVSDPPLPYVRIAEILDVPIGGLGPTRARCLEKLRRSEPLAAFLDGARR